MQITKNFASDNNSGVHPNVLEAMENVNVGHCIGYGDDQYTNQAKKEFKKIFGDDIEIFFAFGGTGANVIGLKTITNSFNSVICADVAHINVDECGAVEKFTGCKLLTVPTTDGKLTPEKIKPHLHGFGFEHHSQPKVISITQATEMGTVYTPEEIHRISQLAQKYDMHLHMDGARICNAAISLNKNLREITRDVGVDVLSFGGTKNGMMFGEAIIFFNQNLANHFRYIRKQGMQLFSKMRYVSAQFLAFFTDDLWKENAKNANAMAKLLEKDIRKIPQIRITQNVESNGVFAIIPKPAIPILQEKYFFYIWNEDAGEVRWMCSFDTTKKDVKNFVRALEETLIRY